MHRSINRHTGAKKGTLTRGKCILLVVLCILIVTMVGIFYYIDRSVTGEEVEDTQAFVSSQASGGEVVILNDTVYLCTDDIESILFLGTDQSGNEATEEQEPHGAMADMLMVAVINHTKQEFSILQLNRDTITNVHLLDTDGVEVTSMELQLCTAHWYGGDDEINCENTVRSVRELLGGVGIDTYYSLSWEGITTLNSAVDGVTLTIQNDFSDVDPSLAMGETLTLTDEQAYTFLRVRYGVDGSDNVSRMERHRQYMTAWIQKVRELSAEDSTFPAKVYQELNPYAFTNLTGSQIGTGAQQVFSYNYLGIFNFDGTVTQGSRLGDGIDHMEFFPDEESVEDLLCSLYDLEEMEDDPWDYAMDDTGTWHADSPSVETGDDGLETGDTVWIGDVEYIINGDDDN